MIRDRTVDTLQPLAIDPQEKELATARAMRRPFAVDVSVTMTGYLARSVVSRPDAPAVVHGAERLSFRELAGMVSVLRECLVRNGCGPGQVVAATGPRSGDTLALFLAIESLGAVYLPLDPGWPVSRVRLVLTGSGAGLLIAYGPSRIDDELSRQLGGIDGVCLVVIAGDELREAARSADPAGPTPDSCDPAEARYVIYTSGSTGRPKGAVVEHRGMLNHLWAKVVDLDLSERDVVAFTAPLVFDIAIWQMLAPLLVGGVVAVLGPEDQAFPRLLYASVRRVGASVVELVPTAVGWLLNGARTGADLPALRWLISTGEELPVPLARRVLDTLPRVRLLNAYGPTECSDDVTHHEVRRPDLVGDRLPIGRPVPNATLYVLARSGDRWRSAAEGETGELFVGGIPVGAGYINDPATTATAFFRDVLDPGSPTGRLYRTGDGAVVRDGVVHYLGRLDRQVKIAGVRVEPGEIEAVLRRHPAVRQCAVVSTGNHDSAELVAYCVSGDAELPTNALHELLGAALPKAMLPSRWHRVDALPLTPNGKVDYRRLQARGTSR